MNNLPAIRMTSDQIKALKKMGFSYAVIAAERAGLVAEVEALFRSRNDASRFKTGMCRMYGQYTYEVVSL